MTRSYFEKVLTHGPVMFRIRISPLLWPLELSHFIDVWVRTVRGLGPIAKLVRKLGFLERFILWAPSHLLIVDCWVLNDSRWAGMNLGIAGRLEWLKALRFKRFWISSLSHLKTFILNKMSRAIQGLLSAQNE